MLNTVKNSFKTIFINTLVIVLIASFVLWGISGLTLGAANTAINVGDVKISASEFEKEYRNQLRAVENNFGKLTPEQIATLQVVDNTIAILMRKALLDNSAKELDLYVSKDQLKNTITATPTFADETGAFNMNMYRNVLSRNGYSVEGFEEMQRGNILRMMLQGYFIGNYLNDKSVDLLLSAEKEVMDIDVVEITEKDIGKISAPTMAEISAYHDANANAFTTTETRDIQVLSLRTSEMAKTVTLTEDARSIYDANPESYIIPEKRSLEHILLFDETEANEVLASLKENPRKFKTLVKEKSKDPVSSSKGGSMGNFTYEELIDTFGPDFSEKAFDVAPSALSDVIQSDFGYHIVRIAQVTAEKTQTFAEAKASIIAEEKSRLAEDLYFELQEKVDDDLAGGLTLTEVAKEYNLPLEQHKAITPSTLDILYAEKIIPAAFEIETAGNVSAALDLENESGVLYVELANITPVRNLTLEEAQETISKAITEEKTVAAMREKANNILEAAKSGTNLKTAARNAKVSKTFTSYKNVGRNKENAPQWVNTSLTRQLFNLKPGTALEKAVTTGNGFAVIVLKKRYDGTYTDDDKQHFAEMTAASMNDDLYQQYVNSLYEKTTVDYNEPLIQRIVDLVN